MGTGVLFACLLTAAGSAAAGESMFNRAYTTDTVPAQRWQLQQDFRRRSGRVSGSYDAWDLRSAVQHGLRDDLQLSLNASVLHIDASNAPDDYQGAYLPLLNKRKTGLQALSVELLRRFSSPETDPVGLALALEPTLVFLDFHNGNRLRNSWALRSRAILQKDYLEDRLVLVLNTALAYVSEHTVGVAESRKSEVDWNNEAAAVMRVASHWFLGAEARNYNDFPDLHRPRNSTYSLGPVAHYGARRFWANLGILYQVYGKPNGPGYGDRLYLRGSERWEATLKLAAPF